MRFVTKHKKLFIFFLVFMVLVAACGVFVHTLNQPSEGVITSSQASETPSKVPLLRATGKTVSFLYPASFQKLATDALMPGDSEKFVLVNPQLSPRNLAIQIRKLPSGSLNDDGGYNFRNQNPVRYSEQIIDIHGNQISIITDQSGGYSKTAFFTHQGLVANVTLISSSDSKATDMDKALHTVLGSWKWL
jgi:hypothetical protein